MPSDLLSHRVDAASPRAAERREVEETFPRFETVTLVVYALLISVVSALHEPWKDETQAWRLGIDSHGIGELVRNSRYEGHPLLWHLMLQAVGQLSRSWWAVVALHVVIACIGAWLVLRYAPFTRLQKVLLVFGYWSAYEYSIVVRPYGLGMVLAVAACVAWMAPRRRIVWAIVCLLLLANTTAVGTALAMAIAAAFAFDWAWPDDVTRRASPRTLVIVGAASLAFMLVVVYLAAAQIRPPADAFYQGEPRTIVSLWDIASMPTVEVRALVPIVRLDGGIRWDRTVLETQSRAELARWLCLSLVLLAVGLVITARRRVSLLFYLVGTVGFFLFFSFIVPGASYHHGYLFIVLLLAAWLAWGAPPSERPRLLLRLTAAVDRVRGKLFTLSLIPSVFAAAEFVVADSFTSFSDARHVADVIRENGLADAPLIAIVRSHAQSVGAFLDRPVLYPLEGKSRTFVYWGPASPYEATVVAADSAATALLTRHCHVLLISSPTKDVAPQTAARAHLLYTTQGRPMSGDRYRVWVMSAPASPRCPTSR
ncbi:MAG: hypothetical protein ACJ79A_08350 [Gemmatimonadaceae bacterium]